MKWTFRKIATYDGDWYVTPVMASTASTPPMAASPLLIREEADGTTCLLGDGAFEQAAVLSREERNKTEIWKIILERGLKWRWYFIDF